MTTTGFDHHDLFHFEDQFFSLNVLEKYDPRLVGQIKRAVEDERRFCCEHLAPLVLEEDRKHFEETGYLSWNLARLAGHHGRLSSFIPRFMGGRGEGSLVTLTPVMEETASVDTAFSGLLGGHGLGLTALMLTMNMRIMDRVVQKIIDNETNDKPFLIDCAITEPSAGTDVEEVDLYPKAKLVCQARRVPGGAVLNGRKVFISTGHMASEHVVLMPFDLRDPVNTFCCFLVPNEASGFSLGRKELKMGQLAAPVSELIFEDCFVPEENIVLAADQYPEERYKNRSQVLLETVLGITRTMVGAMSTGTARGAFERSLSLARKTLHKGRTLINQQWAQTLLTNMYMNVMTARSVYLESTFALMTNLDRVASGSVPAFVNTGPMRKVLQSNLSKKVFHSEWMKKAMIKQVISTPEDNNARIQVMSSLAKVVGSDAAMENAHLALDLFAQAGRRHDRGLEKIFRDAKLLQIFEGTNQLNRLNIFKHLLARHMPGVEVF